MKLFLSYKLPDQQFIGLVHYMLNKHGIEFFYWPEDGRAQPLDDEILEATDQVNGMIAFLGAEWAGVQAKEINYFLRTRRGRPFVAVSLVSELPRNAMAAVIEWPLLSVARSDYDAASQVSHRIVVQLGLKWVPLDGLPNRYVVAYEKEFLKKLRDKDENMLRDLRSECGWDGWPIVVREDAPLENPITDESIGVLSDGTHAVLMDARSGLDGTPRTQFTLPEARPRTHLRYPLSVGDTLRVAILVSGGIAPGINALIEGIVSRHTLYSNSLRPRRNHHLEIVGYREGFKALLRPGVAAQHLTPDFVRNVAENGGSILGTSREDGFLGESSHDARQPDPPLLLRDRNLRRAVTRLRTDGVDILYVIGGDGSVRCAHALWHYARQDGYDLSVVGIPKAMDNDILWVWQSFGFLSAVEEARQAILHMHTEVSSNPRVGIVQLFGSDSGFVASHAGYSTVCDLVLIPEDPLSMEQIYAHIEKKLTDRCGNSANHTSPYAVIVMAETALPNDAERYLNDPDLGLSKRECDCVSTFFRQHRRVRGQTPDELRTAGLKIISKVLEKMIRARLTPPEYWRDFRVITNEPRHLIRSIPPSVTDVIFGERLGTLAVDNAMAGYTDFMVSQWLTEFVLVPLPLVVLGRKRVAKKGIFWKSIVAKTQQPTNPDETADSLAI